MPNRTEPTTTQQNDPFNKYKAAKLNEDEAKRLRQMEIEAAAAASASGGTETKTRKLNPCNIKGIKKTKKETAHCFLAVVENQAKSGSNCSPGTDLNMGEKIVNKYAKVGLF